MDSNEHNKVIAFDTLFCTNHIQMLKIILSYMDNQTQKSMAVYIKFLELNYTIDYFKKHPHPLCGCVEKEASFDILKMCSELSPYCTESERRQLEQIRNVFQGMEMYKEISKTMDMMKDFMPDMASFMGDSSMENAFSAFFKGDSSAGRHDNNGSPAFSGDAHPNDTASGNAFSGDASLNNTLSDDTLSDDTFSGDAASNNAFSGDTALNNTFSGDTASNEDASNDAGSSSGGTEGFNMMNMLMNMLTPEQKQMYEMFGGNQHAE